MTDKADKVHPVVEAAKPIQPCDLVSKCMSHPSSYASEIRYGEKTAKRISEIANTKLEEAWKRTKEIHAANLEAIEHNKRLREQITAVMKAAGIPDKFTEPKPGSRSYPPKRHTVEAGYLGDLKRNVHINDGFSTAEMTYNRLRAEYDKYAKQAAEEDARAQREKERQAEIERAQRKADLDLARIILRYDLPEDSDWPQVLDALRAKDKYADLAVAGLQTRGDWSEGFYRVENAMKRFKIEDDRDKEIAADLLGCMDSDDGRVFRDTKWSYNALLEIVADRQLVADINLALAQVRE